MAFLIKRLNINAYSIILYVCFRIRYRYRIFNGIFVFVLRLFLSYECVSSAYLDLCEYSHAFVNKYFECSKAASHCQTLCYLLCNISYIDHIIVSYSKLSNKSGN